MKAIKDEGSIERNSWGGWDGGGRNEGFYHSSRFYWWEQKKMNKKKRKKQRQGWRGAVKKISLRPAPGKTIAGDKGGWLVNECKIAMSGACTAGVALQYYNTWIATLP
eukprot:TRINITY_DN4710_c0_g1_i2.p1 TRINITY_DN4710_c0_g1~~TRINITY_DN4710_c0_g1_i2.p1  ORF type:complete len:108 (-),score=24.45 TRINITY_DN4710_c0_g1_i2:35-358(-)